ncbi:MAG: hypothetical protein M0P17_01845 [Methanoculleus sp.]|nr:hypothetical protein [Methanoculleus sp.]
MNVICPPRFLPAMTWRTMKMSGRSMTASQKRAYPAARRGGGVVVGLKGRVLTPAMVRVAEALYGTPNICKLFWARL